MLKIDEFNSALKSYENDEEECNVEISFEPIISKATGKIILIAQVEHCKNCNETYVSQLFSCDEEGEEMAIEMGFRDKDDYDEDDE